MNPSELPEFHGSEVLSLHPGDRVVLVARDVHLPPDDLRRILAEWKEQWPEIPVIAVSGMDVVVLHEED